MNISKDRYKFYFVGKPNFLLNELKEILYNNLLSYQVPKKIEIVSAIAKNRTGKIDRKVIV